MRLSNFSLLILAISTLFISCGSHEGVVSEKDIPPYAVRVNAPLNNGDMELIAFYTQPLKPRHGEPFEFITFWRFKKQIPDGWKLFFHFEDKNGEQRFGYNHALLDGKVKKIALNKIIKDTAKIKEYPIIFDASEFVVKTGFFKGNKRTKPAKKFDDGTSRLRAGTVKTDASTLQKKKMSVYAIAMDSVKIDGKLDEHFWKNASVGTPFWRSRGDKIAPLQTKVMAVMDKYNLYIGFDVADGDIHATQTENDSPMYDTDDVVEVYVDANGDGKNYYEIQVSAAGKKFDSSFTSRRKGRNDAWDSKIKYAVSLNGTLNNPKDNDKGWSAEIAIPWESIKDAAHKPPHDGDKWKVFFYRINRYSDKKASGDDFTAWQPPYAGDFHNVRMMGELLFVYEQIK